MNNITLGKFVPYNSLVHRLDPRFKILAMLLLMIGVFLNFANIWNEFLSIWIFDSSCWNYYDDFTC